MQAVDATNRQFRRTCFCPSSGRPYDPVERIPMIRARIAYLVSQYPAASHTFIRREVASLRAQGLDIQTFSIRRPSANEMRAPLDRIEADNTWYVLAAGAPRIAAANLIEAVLHPVRWLGTLWMALGHR